MNTDKNDETFEIRVSNLVALLAVLVTALVGLAIWSAFNRGRDGLPTNPTNAYKGFLAMAITNCVIIPMDTTRFEPGKLVYLSPTVPGGVRLAVPEDLTNKWIFGIKSGGTGGFGSVTNEWRFPVSGGLYAPPP